MRTGNITQAHCLDDCFIMIAIWPYVCDYTDEYYVFIIIATASIIMIIIMTMIMVI